jgi:hypothetical protein
MSKKKTFFMNKLLNLIFIISPPFCSYEWYSGISRKEIRQRAIFSRR